MTRSLHPANDTDPLHTLAGDIRDLRRELTVQRRAIEQLQLENSRLEHRLRNREAAPAITQPLQPAPPSNTATIDWLVKKVQALSHDLAVQHAWAKDRDRDLDLLTDALRKHSLPWLEAFNRDLRRLTGAVKFVDPYRLPAKPPAQKPTQG